MKQVSLSLYQVGSTATQGETNPIDFITHYLIVFPLNRKKRKANNSNTVSTHNDGSVGIVILRLLYVY